MPRSSEHDGKLPAKAAHTRFGIRWLGLQLHLTITDTHDIPVDLKCWPYVPDGGGAKKYVRNRSLRVAWLIRIVPLLLTLETWLKSFVIVSGGEIYSAFQPHG